MDKWTRPANRVLVFCVLLALAAGCTTTTKPKVSAESNVYGDVLWPEVSLFYKEPSDALRERCIEFDQASLLQHCDLRLLTLDYELEQLRESNYFAAVKFADSNVDFAIAITQASFLDESAGGIANAALSGATLLLVPFTQEYDIVVEVLILWRGHVIRETSYEFTFAPTTALYTNPEQEKIELAGKITASIIEDIKNNDVLSGQYLADALGASDYTNELVVPERAGEYLRMGETAQGTPFDGVAFSYARPEFQFDEYAVSIYPIRATSWIDYAAVLSEEMKLIRADFETALKAGEWRDVRFAEQREVLVESPRGGSAGIVQTVDLVDLNGDPYIGRIYLMVKEDKIVALSNFVPVTYEQPDSQVFLSTFLGGLVVPVESPFMAKLRQQQREYDRR
ncbi:MAG: hypothetical protein KDI17_04675 [Halioglobus sp.]|nr:hypothetical protein [Halioglobus sp.]